MLQGHYVTNDSKSLISVTKEQKDLLTKAFSVYPTYSRDWLIDSLLRYNRKELFDFRPKNFKVQFIYSDEAVIEYFATKEEAIQKYPTKTPIQLDEWEYKDINEHLLNT